MAEFLRIPFLNSEAPDLVIMEGESVGIYGENGCGKSELLSDVARLKRGIKFRELPRISSQERALYESETSYFDGTIDTSFKGTVADFVSECSAKVFLSTAEVTDVLQISDSDMVKKVKEVGEFTEAKLALLEALSDGAKLVILDDVFGIRPPFKKALAGLLKKVAKERKTAYLIASTDLTFLTALCSRIAVIESGALAEVNTAKGIVSSPLHPYTNWLVSAHGLKKVIGSTFVRTEKDVRIKRGCRFAHFCPMAVEKCSQQTPEFVRVGQAEVACHRCEK